MKKCSHTMHTPDFFSPAPPTPTPTRLKLLHSDSFEGKRRGKKKRLLWCVDFE